MIGSLLARTTSAASVVLFFHLAVVPAAAGVSPGDAQAALAVHNRARAAVGVGPLTLSPGLSASAQRWADRLASGGTLVHDRSVSGREGENLAMSTGALDARAASAMWLWERATWTAGRGGVVGHYTQMVWSGTSRVGFGIASGRGGTFVVARYAAPGNMRGVKPYPSAGRVFAGR